MITSQKEVNDFFWGFVIKVHSIGEYDIFEYEDKTNVDKIMFHPYVNGKDTHNSFQTLDEAIVFSIAIVHNGINTRAHNYFFNGINTKE